MKGKVLGKIEKPTVESYRKEGKRKLFVVPLFVRSKGEGDFPLEFANKLRKYWKQVEARIGELEAKLGKIEKIYCEMVDREGEEALKVIWQMDEDLGRMIKSFVERGAKVAQIEDKNLLEEHFDLVRCLSIGLKTVKISGVIAQLFSENLRERIKFISNKIKDDLEPGQVGVLFIRESSFLDFPQDVEVFKVFPPALDEVKRYIQDKT